MNVVIYNQGLQELILNREDVINKVQEVYFSIWVVIVVDSSSIKEDTFSVWEFPKL